ncbi:MAG TPA: hypothetical protein VGK73_32700 [Polyangiaceae bacterium]
MCLAFRGSIDFNGLWQDPRGLTGSELAAVRLSEWFATLGHETTLYTKSPNVGTNYGGVAIADIDGAIADCDVAVAINEPDFLRKAPAGSFRVAMMFLNDVSFTRAGFYNHVDLFCSPSAPHLEQIMTNPAWRRVEVTPDFPNGREQYTPDPAKWCVVPLGCDPERFELPEAKRSRVVSGRCENCEEEYEHNPGEPPEFCSVCSDSPKIPGRVVHCSSPDRGLHWLLQEWPAIKRAVPHATLHVFYRLEPWLRGFDQTPFFPPIEPLRARANYVEECLRRFREMGGLGVTLRDSVSRETIEREMAQAECLAFPCDTTTWSEGFSCATLEGCAARACPVITDCDALAGVYGGALPVVYRVGDWQARFRDEVIRALTDSVYREEVNAKAHAFALEHTWKRTAERILEEIGKRR